MDGKSVRLRKDEASVLDILLDPSDLVFTIVYPDSNLGSDLHRPHSPSPLVSHWIWQMGIIQGQSEGGRKGKPGSLSAQLSPLGYNSLTLLHFYTHRHSIQEVALSYGFRSLWIPEK
jgi:hypothetical protein